MSKSKKSVFSINPVCAKCGRLATVVDHIQAHKGNVGLFWGTKNW